MDEISEAGGRRNRRLNFEEKEDRISSLPDSLLHHILSFLPSTIHAIRTGILSKQWKNQWTHVPVLIFYRRGTRFSHVFVEDFARFIDSILLQHNCSKIKKLYLAYEFEKDTNFSWKIRYATTIKHVEELILHSYSHSEFVMPKFLCDNDSLVKLEMSNCVFMDDCTINWGSLKALKVDGSFWGKFLTNVSRGSPSLESLELQRGGRVEGGCCITSKYLKTLILSDISIAVDDDFEISCPKLEELFVSCASLRDKVIENVISGCPLLRFLKLDHCYFDLVVIASKSLRKLVLREVKENCALEISCPNLKVFDSNSRFYGSRYRTFEMMNTPRLIYAGLDFVISQSEGCHEDKAKKIFEQLQNVKELTLGSWFIKNLTAAEMGGLSYLWVNNKSLTLNGPNFEHLPQIVCSLRSSPMLERLVIVLQVYKRRRIRDFLYLDDYRKKNYWNSNGTDFNCLSHLKTVEIIGLSEEDAKVKSVLNFIEFLLKNARVLEKFLLVIDEDCGEDFALTVVEKVSSFPTCSGTCDCEVMS